MSDLLAEAMSLVQTPGDSIVGVAIHIEYLSTSVHFSQFTFVFGGHPSDQT